MDACEIANVICLHFLMLDTYELKLIWPLFFFVISFAIGLQIWNSLKP
jgi:hypothetical protein